MTPKNLLFFKWCGAADYEDMFRCCTLAYGYVDVNAEEFNSTIKGLLPLSGHIYGGLFSRIMEASKRKSYVLFDDFMKFMEDNKNVEPIEHTKKLISYLESYGEENDSSVHQ